MAEEKKIGLEEMSLEIITNAGTASSMYVEALEAAKTGNFEEDHNLAAEGETIFINGHPAHTDLVNAKVGVEDLQYMFLVMHAGDQLMSAETLKIVCDEPIDLLEQNAAMANQSTSRTLERSSPEALTLFFSSPVVAQDATLAGAIFGFLVIRRTQLPAALVVCACRRRLPLAALGDGDVKVWVGQNSHLPR